MFVGKKDEIEFETDREIFLNSFPGLKTFQLFDDTQAKRREFSKVFHCQSLPWSWTQRLEELNCNGVGVFLCVNETDGTGRTNASIKNIRAVFADFDGQDVAPAYDDDPSMVVETSPGKYHAYFFTDPDEIGGFPVSSFTTIQTAIAAKYNSDPAVKDLARVMRVPGFYHTKGEPFLSRITHYTGNVFAYGDLVEMFPPIPREQFSGKRWEKVQVSFNSGEFKGTYGAGEGNRNTHIMKRIGGMIKRNLSWHEIESEAMKEAISCSPPLTERETINILKSAKRYS